MNNYFKILSICLSMALLSTILYACADSGKNNDERDPAEFTYIFNDFSGEINTAELKSENNLVKNYVENKIKEDTGYDIKLKFEPVLSSAFSSRLVAIQSNPNELKKYDAFGDYYTYDNFISNISRPGLIQPLNDLLEEYGQNILKYFTEDEWAKVTDKDGNILAIPNRVLGAPYTLVIRGDILEEYKTSEGKAADWTVTKLSELEDFFTYVKKTYPNMFPIGSDFNNLDRTLGAWFGLPREGYWDKDGRITRRELLPEYRYYLETVKKWYDRGWIAKDFSTYNYLTMTSLFEKGSTASTVLYYSSLYGITQKIRLVDSKAILTPLMDIDIDTFDGKKFKSGIPVEYGIGSVTFVIKAAPEKNKENVIKFFNWVYSDIWNSYTLSAGIKGVHYDVYEQRRLLITIGKYADPTVIRYRGLYTGMFNSELLGDDRYIYGSIENELDIIGKTQENTLRRINELINSKAIYSPEIKYGAIWPTRETWQAYMTEYWSKTFEYRSDFMAVTGTQAQIDAWWEERFGENGILSTAWKKNRPILEEQLEGKPKINRADEN